MVIGCNWQEVIGGSTTVNNTFRELTEYLFLFLFNLPLNFFNS